MPDAIFDALDRCTYAVLLEISVGGPKSGRFYEHFTKTSEHYETVDVDLKECTHIPKEKIEQTIAIFGLDHRIRARRSLANLRKATTALFPSSASATYNPIWTRTLRN